MTLPCVGAGITLVDPGPKNTSRNRTFSREERLLRAHVEKVHAMPASKTSWMSEVAVEHITMHPVGQASAIVWRIQWRCGIRTGFVLPEEEGFVWIVGHGQQVRDALIAARALRRSAL